MYHDPKITVRIGDKLSGPSEYLCGVRQGCPASPILFDFFINDIFKGISGVEVPGLPNRIPGLLFADDAVVLADSAENLQTSLDAITVWSDTWEMAVNASKCAIMAINCDDPAELTLQRQTIST
ncbi:Retrovirus-related Pol polyprotein from type-1 retrotransposable element R2, partial [Smittium culicis]